MFPVFAPLHKMLVVFAESEMAVGSVIMLLEIAEHPNPSVTVTE